MCTECYCQTRVVGGALPICEWGIQFLLNPSVLIARLISPERMLALAWLSVCCRDLEHSSLHVQANLYSNHW